jgi:two-component system cell cycle sensor histidine kinase/response regulator CckA
VFGLNELVARVDKLVRRVIGEDVMLSVIPAPDLGLVRADPGQIEQVLMTLVVNARDAMENGGYLTVEAQYYGAMQLQGLPPTAYAP